MKKVYYGSLIVIVLVGISLGLYLQKRALAANQSGCESATQKAISDYQDRKTESGLPSPNDTLTSRPSYNKTLKRCFIELRDSFGNSEVSVTSTIIMDTPKEDNLGGCLEAVQGKGQDPTLSCHDSDDNPISREVFQGLEAKYMGSGHI